MIITADESILITYQGHDQSILDKKIEIIHQQPHLHSDILVKVVLFAAAKINLQVIVRVAQGAKETNTFLKIQVLLIGKQAEAKIIPALEIMENSVKAGHAAIISRINAEQLFYLQSRGLTLQAAEKQIIKGFLSDPVK